MFRIIAKKIVQVNNFSEKIFYLKNALTKWNPIP